MIVSRTETAKGAFGDTFARYTLTSTNHDKIVTVRANIDVVSGKVVRGKGFTARNESNGSRFEADTYQDVLKKLESRGW